MPKEYKLSLAFLCLMSFVCMGAVVSNFMGSIEILGRVDISLFFVTLLSMIVSLTPVVGAYIFFKFIS